MAVFHESVRDDEVWWDEVGLQSRIHPDSRSNAFSVLFSQSNTENKVHPDLIYFFSLPISYSKLFFSSSESKRDRI